MKKLFFILSTSLILTACSSLGNDTFNSSSINQVRGKNSARITDAELKQHRKQRADEVEEAMASRTKSHAQMENMRDGMDTVHDGLNVFDRLRSIF